MRRLILSVSAVLVVVWGVVIGVVSVLDYPNDEYAYVEDHRSSQISRFDMRTRLSLPVVQGMFPQWSPDGSKLAYATDEGLMLVNADGSGAQRLIGQPQGGHATWSPDGTRLAYSALLSPGIRDIYVYHFDIGRAFPVVSSASRDQSPQWSPDGSKLVYTSDRDGNDTEIYVYDFETRQETVLTDNWTFETFPTWTHDGRIVFASARDERLSLYIINADGSEEIRLVDDFWSNQPALLDANWLLFSGQQNAGQSSAWYRLHLDTGEIDYVLDGDYRMLVRRPR